MTLREEANAIIAACVRNHSSLEDLHVAGHLDQEEIKTLMIEVCSNLEVVLRWRDELVPEQFGALIQVMSLNTATDWDTESKTGGLVKFEGMDFGAILEPPAS